MRAELLTRRLGFGARAAGQISFWLEALVGPLLIAIAMARLMLEPKSTSVAATVMMVSTSSAPPVPSSTLSDAV